MNSTDPQDLKQTGRNRIYTMLTRKALSRSEFKRKPAPARGEARAKPTLARTGFKRPTKPVGEEQPRSTLRRTRMKWKRRRAKPGDDPRYKAFVKKQPCVIGGQRCGKVDPHHLIDGKGEARSGVGQTAPDKFLIPMCRRHHDLFHAGKGIFAGWDDAQRLTFQEQEVERLNAIWSDLQELDVLQEPARKAI